MKQQKTTNLIYIFGFGTIMLIILKGLLVSLTNGVLLTEEPIEMDQSLFWIYYSLASVLIGIIIYFFIYQVPKIQWLNEQDEESIIEKKQTREVSEDSFILLFLLSFIFYALPVSLNEPETLTLVNYYLYFLLLSFLYIALLKISHIYRAKREEEPLKLFQLGSASNYFSIITNAVIGFLLIFLIGAILPTGSGIFTEEGRKFLSFMIFASIPAEELVFRGLLIMLLLIFSREIIADILHIPQEERKNNLQIERIAWTIAIWGSSIIFGLFHLNRYGYNFYTILYLTLLGVICGIAYYKKGLLSAYLIHAFNNIGASPQASFELTSFLGDSFTILVIFLIGILILMMVFFSKNQKSKNTKNRK